MSAPSIYAVVMEYAERLGIEFRPHDLRRTYGKLAHKGGAKIEQIQLSYGHASLTTTERYLGKVSEFRTQERGDAELAILNCLPCPQ
jgi:integrase